MTRVPKEENTALGMPAELEMKAFDHMFKLRKASKACLFLKTRLTMPALFSLIRARTMPRSSSVIHFALLGLSNKE